MESLNDTVWDVLISGTGLPQSLLALALSRSGKKVLHVDQNDYYGGAEAAFSLQEATDWVEKVNLSSKPTPFSAASITHHQNEEGSPDPRLGFSRAYSVSLSPHLIYARSNLVPALVSSKVYRQLEFLAVGSWWIYQPQEIRPQGVPEKGVNHDPPGQNTSLRRIPGSREDVFADKSIDLRSTRSLMKALKLAADADAHLTAVNEHGNQSYPSFLASEYKIGPKLQAPLQALTLSSAPPSKTTVGHAIPQLHKHLTSIGIFGPGFGAVTPKWGGLAEIAQVACRAGAVSGGVYVLNKGIESIDGPVQTPALPKTVEETGPLLSTVKLQGGDEVKARWIIGTPSTLCHCSDKDSEQHTVFAEVTHVTAIVSSSLTSLFPPPSEGSPPPGSIVVVLPPGAIGLPKSLDLADIPLVYLIIHSSDTGECPEGQTIIYTSTTLSHPSSTQFLSSAIKTFLSAVPNEPTAPDVLWTIAYTQHHSLPSPSSNPKPQQSSNVDPGDIERGQHSGIIRLQDLSPSLALDDNVLKDVRAVWERITLDDGDARGAFMQFEDRVGFGGEDGEDDEDVS